MIKVKPEEIKGVADFVYRASGIVLDAKKAYLIESRIGPLVEEAKLLSYAELMRSAGMSRILKRKILDAITTNETLFFRDNSPFEMLQHKVVPDIIDRRESKAGPTKIRIWSAACSTGQEIYSIAITLKELLPDMKGYRISLLGTDISDAAVAQASYGKYNKFEIERGLSMDKLKKYFTPDGNTWKVKDEIRAMASFKKLNLMEPFSGLGKFDIIFCRNVAIYFSLEDRKKLFNKIADMLEPDGFLIIGSTESLTGISDRFAPQRHIRAIFYQLK